MSGFCYSCGCHFKDLVTYRKINWGEHGDEIFHLCSSCGEGIEKYTYRFLGKKIKIYKKVVSTTEGK